MIRRGSVDDLDVVFAIKRDASVAALAHVFPPDRYPYPDDDVRAELRSQLTNPLNVLLLDSEERGFALAGKGWLHGLFVRERAWGAGVADELHDAALAALRTPGDRVASLWCLAENVRARRFYERRGWRLNGRERVVPFPPHPLDVGYSIDL